jgi:RND family efflux transporter MFP subunit
MSAIKQILLSLAVVLVAAAGWYAWDRGYIFAKPSVQSADARGGAQGTGGGPQRAGGGGAGPAGRGVVFVVTAPVGTDNTGIDVQAIGTVAAARAVTLYPEASGIVTDVAFKAGQQVKTGDTLVKLDDSDQQVALDKAKVALDTANDAKDRAEQLAKTNNITFVALTTARFAAQTADIEYKAAQNDLAKRSITAPFGGTVGLADLNVGDLVSSSKPLVTLDDMSKVTVAFDVPERASGLVAVGQEVSAVTDALAGQTFKGAISAVDSRVDPVARTLRVEATLPNDANVLKPGMALTVSMSFPGTPHPSVPSLAVQWDRGGSYVWKVADGVVHRVPIQIIGRRSGTAIVTGELAQNDPVVVEGLQRLREGIQVATAEQQGGGGQRPAGAGASDNGAAGPEAAAAPAGGTPAANSGQTGQRPRRPPSG